MKKSTSVWSRVNHFLHEHFLILLVIVGAGWWLLGGSDKPIVFPRQMASMDYAHTEEMAADMSMVRNKSAGMQLMGRGGGMRIMPEASADFAPDAEERKIVKNGNLNVEVTDTESAKKEAESIISNAGGAVTNMNSWETRPGVLAYNMTTRIPAEKLEETIETLSNLGVKKSESFSTSDITAQYMDTENRLKNLDARRERLREMMNRETKNLNDVLQIDRELANVQSEIERLERTQKNRDTNVSYSTLHLMINPEPKIGDTPNPHWSVKKSWTGAVNDLILKSKKIADKFIKLIVFAPIWIPILLIVWFVHRRFWKH